MRKLKRTAACLMCFEIVLIVIFNILYAANEKNTEGRLYRVEAKRAAEKLKDVSGVSSDALNEVIDLSEYETILNISRLEVSLDEGKPYNNKIYANTECSNDYVIENVNGILYRIEYRNIRDKKPFIFMNLALVFMLVITMAVFWHVYRHILTPFNRMERLSQELAKGSLAVPVKEEKNKYFGKFLWSLDMLRESLEEKKEKELELQKEKKTMILSLSHDIKNPIAAIELYVKALERGLYEIESERGLRESDAEGGMYETESERGLRESEAEGGLHETESEKGLHIKESEMELCKKKALQGILDNTEKIKDYVNEITAASREEFLNLTVNNGEFYLWDVMKNIEDFYSDKLSVIHTEFKVEKTGNCLLKGDADRLIEVLQNLMENAVKYGDGGRISISFSDEEDCRLIKIENTGTPVKPEELPYLSDSFYRGSNSKDVKGSGLGLYICKNLMKKMDGDIFVKAEENVFTATVVARKA